MSKSPLYDSTTVLFSILFLVVLTIGCQQAKPDFLVETYDDTKYGIPHAFDPNTIIVKFNPALGEQLRKMEGVVKSALPTSLQQINTQFGVSKIVPVAFDGQDELIESLITNGVVSADVPRVDHIFRLTITGDVLTAVKAFESIPFVRYAEPNFLVETYETPNDEFFNPDQLWGLHQINTQPAWERTQGENVIVAVIDSGVDSTHSELKANIYTNLKEIPDNNIDDDNNGYVDDVNGWDFVDNDNLPDDPNGHGTHVAGTIAAVGNNQYGIVGVAPKSQILPIRALGASGGGKADALQKALIYAADSGVDIINNSWGGRRYSQAFADAIDYAHARGVLVISAAGNSSGEEACEHTPANVERGMAVSSFSNSGQRSGFSNRGVKIDVGAPGGNNNATTPADGILSTGSNQVDWEGSGREFLMGGDGEQYLVFNGTSMATPHVAGLAALIKSQHPDWSPEQIRQAIRQAADDIGTPGFDTDSGYGLINADMSTTIEEETPAVALIAEPRNCTQLQGSIDIVGSADAANLDFYTLQVAAGEMPTDEQFTTISVSDSAVDNDILARWDTANVPNGGYTLRLLTHDHAGNISEDRNFVTMTNVLISSPIADELIKGNKIEIVGNVPQPTGENRAQFEQYHLDYAAGSDATDQFIPIHQSSKPTTGKLATWNLSDVQKGEYTLRLTAIYDHYESVMSINVIVDANTTSVRSFWMRPMLHDFWASLFHLPSITDRD